MNSTRIALASAALGVALLVGIFAYLAYDAGIRGPRAPDAEGTATAVAGERGQQDKRRSAARTDADGPESGDDPRPAEAGGGEPAVAEAAPPSAGARSASSEPSAPARTEGDASVARGGVPAYNAPVRESRAGGITEVVVGTEATGEEEMRLVASDLASYYPGPGVLLVEFREAASGASGRETGFAMVFGSREAAMAPDLDYAPEEVDEIFEEDGGIRAVSYEDFGRENPGLRDELARISSR